MRPITLTRASAVMLLGILVSCSASSDNKNVFGSGRNSTGGTGGTDQSGAAGGDVDPGVGAGGTDTGPLLDASVGNDPDATGISSCPAGPDEDKDQDGYSINQGDCNDCDPNANPGAFDVIGGVDGGAGVDEDCDGQIDNEPMDCDQGFPIEDADAMNGARSIGLCRAADPNAAGKDKTWGVLSAKYVLSGGAPGMNAMSHGLVPRFGAALVQQGMSMLVLSSGTARAPGQPGFESPGGADMGTSGFPPDGYPKESPSCPDVITGDCNDPAALQLEIRVPTNANSFSFNLNFYTYEFPNFICSTFNDFFVTMMMPPPPSLPDGNISFDQDGNPISVNNSLLQVCVPQEAGDKNFPCPLGPDLLTSTGFDEPGNSGPHAATGWLQTRAPVEPGSVVTLRFAIWDSGDHILDSTVLIDNFQWSVEPASAVETTPVPVPK